MGFDVGLINNIEPEAVAELIPPWRIGIMGAAYRVEVVLLHQQNVLHHIGFSHPLAVLMVMLMSVHAADEQRLAIHLQQAVANLDLAKTDITGLCLKQPVTLP
ncbi:hypothetical protein D3C77_416070 [compost metagenome]